MFTGTSSTAAQMISGPPDPTPVPAPAVLTQRQIRVVAAIYLIMLLILGGVMFLRAKFAEVAMDILLLVVIPAILYALAVFRYGKALFGDADATVGARFWSRWMWIAGILFSLMYVLNFVYVFAIEKEVQEDFKANFGMALLARLVFVILLLLLPLLWAWIGQSAFLRPLHARGHSALSSPAKIRSPLLAGGALVLSSLVLNVNYDSPGWQVFVWQGGWVSDEFMVSQVISSWFPELLHIFYVSAILFALCSVIVGIKARGEASFSPRLRMLMLDISVVILWFTLTNYFGNLLYVDFVPIFDIWPSASDKAACLAITAGWLIMFAVGTFLWFCFRRRSDLGARTYITLLVIWALPFMLMPLSTFFIPASWGIFGLITFVAGVQILAAGYWKLARTSQASA